MTTKQKKARIKRLVKDMLNESHRAMINKIDKAINCGGVDIESWDPNNAPMVLPKCIVTAILQDESTQYEGKGTGTANYKKVKREVHKIRCFI